MTYVSLSFSSTADHIEVPGRVQAPDAPRRTFCGRYFFTGNELYRGEEPEQDKGICEDCVRAEKKFEKKRA